MQLLTGAADAGPRGWWLREEFCRQLTGGLESVRIRIGETMARRASTSSITRREDVIVRLGQLGSKRLSLQSTALLGGVEAGGEVQNRGAEGLLRFSAETSARLREAVENPVLVCLLSAGGRCWGR